MRGWRGSGWLCWCGLIAVACSDDGSPSSADGSAENGSLAGRGSDGADPSAGGAGAGGDATTTSPAFDAARAALDAAVADTASDVPFTLILGNTAGTFYVGSQGDSSATTRYESASTSKWVAAAVTLWAVDQGALALTTRPQDVIPWWANDDEDWRSAVTLEQLLSFTSGLQPTGAFSDALCISLPNGSFENCVQNIFAGAADDATPGAAFVYGSHHLQVSGLMTLLASEQDGWSDLFAAFQADTGLFPTGTFDLPSVNKPRLAGGMHWTAEEYVDFLRSLFIGDLLSAESQAAMYRDHTPSDTVAIVESPVAAVGMEWHYGLGNWLECPAAAWDASCDALQRHSSPGAYGAYPFIDRRQGFYGILARQGDLGTFADGLATYLDLKPRIDDLAAEAP